MALLHLDGFDHYTAAQQGYKLGLGYAGIPSLTAPHVGGRTGTGIRVGFGQACDKVLQSVCGTLAAGVAWWGDIGVGTPIGFKNSITDNRIYAYIMADGRVTATCNGAYAAVASDEPVVFSRQWNFIELEATHGTTAISYSIRVNEEEVLSGSFAVSADPEDACFDTVMPWGVGGGNASVCDDLYVTGGGFLGDGQVNRLYPTGDGDVSQWVASGAGAHYADVDEEICDDGASEITADAAGQEDRFTFTAPAGVGQVLGIQGNVIC